MKANIQIPAAILPKINMIKRKFHLSTKEAFLFLMGCNIPSQKKDNLANSESSVFCDGYNTPHRIRKITIIEVEVA